VAQLLKRVLKLKNLFHRGLKETEISTKKASKSRFSSTMEIQIEHLPIYFKTKILYILKASMHE
jgi:hypothetical protein